AKAVAMEIPDGVLPLPAGQPLALCPVRALGLLPCGQLLHRPADDVAAVGPGRRLESLAVPEFGRSVALRAGRLGRGGGENQRCNRRENDAFHGVAPFSDSPILTAGQ